MKISFCIITDGKEPAKLQALMDSICNIYDVPSFEIIIVGCLSPLTMGPYLGIDMPSAARQGRLGALRNRAAGAASGDIIVVSDDDMFFDPSWYHGLVILDPSSWDVLSCVIQNPDGTRYWDWKWHEGGINALMDYNETSPNVSLTGGLVIMKREVFQKIQWDNDLGFNQAEDVDFSNKLKAAGFRIEFNPHSKIIHNGPYTQKGRGVVKYARERGVNE